MRLRLICLVLALLIWGCEGDPNFPKPEGGPPTAFTAYWTVPGFADISDRGPEKAVGVIFWSHGVRGTAPQYQGQPPLLIRDLAQRGWDVVKINRNNLFEVDWSGSGLKHVADLEARVGEAKRRGYRHVVVAGQSYGGAISLEVAKRRDDILAVMAFAPGHGSDAETGLSSRRLYENLIGLTVEQIRNTKAQRLWISLPSGDTLMPDEGRSEKARAALIATGKPFFLVDEKAPVRGHGSVATSQYRLWYGKCVQDVVNPTREISNGAQPCDVPNPAPRFLYPTSIAVKAPGKDLRPDLAALSGRWIGAFEDNGMEVEIIVEAIEENKATVVVVTGAGPNLLFSMGSGRYQARIEGATLRFAYSDGRPLTVSRDAARNHLELVVHAREGGRTFRAGLNRKKDG